MNINDVVTLITTVGFPIVACGALYFQIIKNNEQHKEEMDKVTTALNNNTLALQKLSDRLDAMEVKNNEQ